MYIEYNISKIIRAELETPIAEKVCYFVEYYFYCTGKYQNLDLEGHLLDVHAILRVIRDELDNKGNKRNLNFMKQCLDSVIVMLIERHAQNPESDLSSLLLQREIENQELKEELKHMDLLDWIRNLD